jgi:hypothetical protein
MADDDDADQDRIEKVEVTSAGEGYTLSVKTKSEGSSSSPTAARCRNWPTKFMICSTRMRRRRPSSGNWIESALSDA